MAFYTCQVNEVGPASDATETPNGTILVNLTDQGSPPAFEGCWFYFAENSKATMLAVALAAVSNGATVEVGGDPPNPNNEPWTEIQRFYLIAP
jgi:hypothetical protein